MSSITGNSADEIRQLKEAGNTAYGEGDWATALELYTKALKLIDLDVPEKAVLLKNRAAVHLKRNDHEATIKDCTAALQIMPNDPKALFRRCQAFESLERFEEAYKDARDVYNLDRNNKLIQPILKRLHDIVQDRLTKQAQTATKVNQMMQIAFDLGCSLEKRETAISNIVVLAKEKAGSELLLKEGIIQKIVTLLKTEKNPDVIVNSIRTISEVCKSNALRTKTLLQEIGVPWFLELLNTRNEEQVNAAEFCVQVILNSLSGMKLKEDPAPDKELCKENQKEIETILTCLSYCTTSRSMSGLGRNAVLNLIMRNAQYRALDWAERFVDINGVQRLMEVASELEEYKYESSMEVTPDTRTSVSVCLAKIYENMYHDHARERFTNKVEDFIKERLITPEMESKVRVVVGVTTLLLGPLDVGSSIVAKEGIMEMILVMANSGDFLQQRVACEAIIAAANKKDKAVSIINQGVNILKKLYQSGADNIKVRALVGLCKLGSSGGSDASWRPFADGSTLKLAEACRRFLINPAKDKDMRKWAAEGLSYLTLDAEVKEKLIEDRPALRSLIELARTGDLSVVYGVVSTLVNLCNAYDKQEIIPEMIELAKFAKRHIPEQHELDDPDFITKRTEILGHEGVTTALVALCKTESNNCKELIARVFNALCEQQTLRGTVVQQGGAKALIPLALDGTDKGKRQAAQALARIGITINPEVAFPGQRMCEVVRPLLSLLHPECSALENFEALMALCNLAGFEPARKRIIKDNGFPKMESYIYEEHEMLRRASVQALSNMLFADEVVKIFEGKNDRTKYLLLLTSSEDLDTAKAAAGGLAILTSSSKRACKKIFEANQWHELLCYMLSHTDRDLQHRGAVVVYNIVASSKTAAETIMMNSELKETLEVLKQLELPEYDKIRDCVKAAYSAADEWKHTQEEPLDNEEP